MREGLLDLENSFGGAPSSVHATQHRHYSRVRSVRRAKAYRMLASLGHLGVAALATLEIFFRGRPFSFSSDLRLSIVLRSEKRAHLGQAPARTPR